MSISIHDITSISHGKEGIRKPRVEASLTVTESVPIIETRTADPIEQLYVAKRRVIHRLYGDIGRAFEELITLLDNDEGDTGRAIELTAFIRAALQGGTPSSSHRAPSDPHGLTQHRPTLD